MTTDQTTGATKSGDWRAPPRLSFAAPLVCSGTSSVPNKPMVPTARTWASYMVAMALLAGCIRETSSSGDGGADTQVRDCASNAEAMQLATGSFHTCARLTMGTVRCWGAGFGTIPFMISGLPDVAEVAAGGDNTCVRLTSGIVRCWGSNGYGQLGDGTTIYRDRTAPSAVAEVGGAVQVTTSGLHTCARLTGGTVRCWGANYVGQLGDGTTTGRTTSVAVVALGAAAEIVVGGFHSCARLMDGTVQCWGNNGRGQLGDGTTMDRAVPVSVAGISNAVQLAAGYDHTCARLVDGTVRCWGSNFFGELGDSTRIRRTTPVVVADLRDAVEIGASPFRTCARLSNGTARCWGASYNGPETGETTPVDTGVQDIVQITTGGDGDSLHTCTLLRNGSVLCWGNNGRGQLGDGTTMDRRVATPVCW